MSKYFTRLLVIFIVLAVTATAGLPPTTSKISGDTNNVTTFNYQFPNFTGTHTGTTVSLGVNGVAGGGTGASTLTANNVILGNGASAVQFVAPGTSGNVLTSNGTSWISSPATAGAGPRTEVLLTGQNGRGSTNTFRRRWSNVTSNTGSAFTVTQSAVNGDTITINEVGLYTITINEVFDGTGSNNFAIVVNDTSNSTPSSFAAGAYGTTVLAMGSTVSGDATSVITVTLLLNINDTIREAVNSTADATGGFVNFANIRITKVSN